MAKKTIKKSVSQKKTDRFTKFYTPASLVILLASTLYWAIRSASLQLHNSDQLINPLLMQNIKTFNGALIPGQHSQLIKWPIYWLIDSIGPTRFVYDFFTVAIVLVTVGLLVLILSKITKAREVFSTLVLALSAVLILVPAMPYSGGILPVNMAMLSTRNLEYPLYIGCLLLIFSSKKLKDRNFWFGTLGLSLLIASDKLFISLSVGGALLLVIFLALFHKWNGVTKAVNWLISGFIASIFGTFILWVINAIGLTHIVSGSSASPYSLVSSVHNFAQAAFYSVSGFLTNFGANPAFDGVTIRSIPHLLATRLLSLGGIAYVVNIIVAIFGLIAVYLIIKITAEKRSRSKQLDNYNILALGLIVSSVIAIAVFILTNHDYEVDSRYLTICLFSIFITLAVVSRNRKFSSKTVKLSALILCISLASGLFMSNKIFNDQAAALKPYSARDTKIAQYLTGLHVNNLVGNYWRVAEIKQNNSNLNIEPLAGCSTPNSELSSNSWNINLHKNAFAYLLDTTKGLTNYPACSVSQILTVYGRPNASYLIEGSLSNPTEKILIYQHGIRKSAPLTSAKAPDTVLPISPANLPYTTCATPTVMNIVAHEDDDLLFMNPDIYNYLTKGDCIRTVYLTAGDAGYNSIYWLGRERGVEAAYNYMIGATNTIWVSRIVQLAANEYINIANPRGNSKVSLIFMMLPDGNLKGQGFPADGLQSLQKLWQGQIRTMTTVDKQSTYTSNQLESAIEQIMSIYNPAIINTQSDYIDAQFPDHSDHIAVGEFVKKAVTQYETDKYANQVAIPIHYYIGYPIRTNPVNVSGQLMSEKINAFVAYAQFDGATCQSQSKCLASGTYGNYLPRQYTNPY